MILKKCFWKYVENNTNKNYINLTRNINSYTISGIFDILKNNNSCCIGYTLTYRCKKHLPQGEKIISRSDPLINLVIFELSQFINIEDIIIDKYKFYICACPICDYIKEQIEDLSAEFFYTNIQLSNVIIFELV